MLVRIIKNNNKNDWDIFALSGPLFNQKLATVEGFRLSNARFQVSSITGFVVGVHGAQIEDITYSDTPTLRSLGVGGAMHECHHPAAHDERNSGWYDTNTLEPLEDARYINGMGHRVYYTTPEDITNDRRAAATLPDSVLAPEPEWTAADHFKAGLSKLKEKIIGG